MHTLKAAEKKNLAAAIRCDSGAELSYYSFIEIALATFEDIPGFETMLPELDLLNELWHIYSTIAE